MLTLMGIIMPLAMMIAVCIYNPSFGETVPHWLLLLGFWANLWYQTIDAVDGKQARRTNNCSPLGQLLDHNLDQISITAQMISVCSLLKLKSNIWAIMLMSPVCFSPHYSIEYRTHFTKFHAYVVGLLGATEQLIVVEIAHLWPYFYPESNDKYTETVTLPGGFKATYGQLITAFGVISGLHYNLTNIVYGYQGAKDKTYAKWCLLPYVQFFLMLWGSSYSQFFDDYAAYFILSVGMYLTYVTAILNLNSTADMKFDWFFYEPILYGAILFADTARLLATNQMAWLHILFFAQTLIKYLFFMASTITQLTSYLEINFLTVGGKGAQYVSDQLMGKGKKK